MSKSESPGSENCFFSNGKWIVAFICWLAISGETIGQPHSKSDSYALDTVKVNDLLAKSTEYVSNEPEKAVNYGIQAKELAEQIGFVKGAAFASKNIGIAYYTQGKYLEAISYWELSLSGFRNMNDLVGISNILNNIGVIHSIQGDYEKALESYLEALKTAEQTGNKKRIASSLNNVGATYALKPETYDKALTYYLKALDLSGEVGDTNTIGTTSVNIGEVYSNKGNSAIALQYFNKSLKAYEDSHDDISIPYTYNAIAKEYKKKGNYDSALYFHQKAFVTSKQVDKKLYMVQSLIGLANTYVAKGETAQGMDHYKEAEMLGKEINAIDELKDIYQGLSTVYAGVRNYQNAFKYQLLLSNVKDTIYNIATDKKLANLQFDFDLQKKQNEITLLTKDKDLQIVQTKKQKFAKNAFMVGLFLAFTIALLIYRNYRVKAKTHKIVDRQKNEIEHLLLNILPKEVAVELQRTGRSTPRHYDSVSVMFTDFKSFTAIADNMSPDELVEELDACFIAFDGIIEKYNLEKIKTIGDSYMCAGGIPKPDENHVLKIVKAGLEVQEYVGQHNARRKEIGLDPWLVRIGIHVGPVVAGVVGKKKYAYDIWGSTVNIASRMESNGEPGKVNISSATHELIKDYYECSYRGKISAKNIGEIDMYFIEHEYTIPKNLLLAEPREVQQ